MDLLSKRITELTESQTLAMAARSRELAAKGIDVINLSLGEPDFLTPEHVREAAKLAIDQGFSFYTPVAGYADTREAVVQKLARDNGLQYTADQIVTSTGAKQSIINVLLCLLNPGDEIIIPTPYWVSYLSMVQLAEGKAILVPAGVEQDFKITPAQLEAAITPKTKAFLFSSPCNPTGSVYTKEELEGLAAVFSRYPHITVISDEIYEYINFDGQHHSIAAIGDMIERTVVVNGLSKGFAMTGWRFGYIAAPLEIAKACVKLQGQFTSATSSITQRAAIAALTGDLAPTFEMREAFRRRRKLVLDGLNKIPGLRCNQPTGAFYVFPEVSGFFGKKYGTYNIQNADDLATYLLVEGHVAVVTGEAFGAPNCIRLSYATSDQKLETAMERMQKALGNLQ
ncbi:MAG: pyridoxal phosphate-dependent aminotransferase [Sphingobacteriaceae bacterium]|nr:pyridoxal phosphate-dependent aminotransferase [Sphingobacteriaceae bacterium]